MPDKKHPKETENETKLRKALKRDLGKVQPKGGKERINRLIGRQDKGKK